MASAACLHFMHQPPAGADGRWLCHLLDTRAACLSPRLNPDGVVVGVAIGIRVHGDVEQREIRERVPPNAGVTR